MCEEDDDLDLAEELLQLHDYKGHELLMNPYTGSVANARERANEAKTWLNSYESYASLIEIDAHEKFCPRCKNRGCDYCLL